MPSELFRFGLILIDGWAAAAATISIELIDRYKHVSVLFDSNLLVDIGPMLLHQPNWINKLQSAPFINKNNV